MKIAIHNLHYLPQLVSRGGLNNYLLELIKQGRVDYLYFDQRFFKNHYGTSLAKTIDDIRSQYSWRDLGLDKTEIIFSSKKLFSQVDVLLNFNGVIDTDMTDTVKNFPGLKIFHIMDYFWVQPGSEQYTKLKNIGVDYLMSYGSPDKYCSYFKKTYPDYIGKVIPVPYGFALRFKNTTPFKKRLQKCIALGSVNPLNRPDAPKPYWSETATFFKKEKWMHKFRKMLADNKRSLLPIMDSLLPVYPQVTDHSYDIVKVLNNYQFFTTCESIYNFPTAKSFEGSAAGSIQVCSTHPCFTDLGFKDGVNCIKHKEFDIKDFKKKITYYLKHQNKLKKIQQNGTKFVRQNYSHPVVASKLFHIIKQTYRQQSTLHQSRLKLKINFKNIWSSQKMSVPRKQKSKDSLVVYKNIVIFKSLSLVSFLYQNILGPLKIKLINLLHE